MERYIYSRMLYASICSWMHTSMLVLPELESRVGTFSCGGAAEKSYYSYYGALEIHTTTYTAHRTARGMFLSFIQNTSTKTTETVQHFWGGFGLCCTSTRNILTQRVYISFLLEGCIFKWHELYFSSRDRTNRGCTAAAFHTRGGENGAQRGGGHDRTRKSTLCLHSRMRILCGPNFNCSALYLPPAWRYPTHPT